MKNQGLERSWDGIIRDCGGEGLFGAGVEDFLGMKGGGSMMAEVEICPVRKLPL